MTLDIQKGEKQAASDYCRELIVRLASELMTPMTGYGQKRDNKTLITNLESAIQYFKENHLCS